MPSCQTFIWICTIVKSTHLCLLRLSRSLCSAMVRQHYDDVMVFNHVLTRYSYIVVIAIAGYRMFGSHTLEEITKNVQDASGGGIGWLNTLTTSMICLIPIPKFALTMNPVSMTLEGLASKYLIKRAIKKHRILSGDDSRPAVLETWREAPRWLQIVIRTLLTALCSGIPFLVSHFDQMLSLYVDCY